MTTRKFETDNTAPVPSEQVEECEANKHCWENVYHQCKSLSEITCCKCGYQMPRGTLRRDLDASEQEVTPEHTPLPWELQVGEQCCFHSGNRVALTVWHGLDTEEPTNETIAEFWPASNDLDIKDAKFVLEAVNSHAELKERVRVLKGALEGLFEHCAMVHKHWGEGSNQKEADAAIDAARAALNKEEKCKES